MQSAAEIRLFILQKYEDRLSAKGLTPATVPDNFDLLDEGIIDSMGVLEIIGGVEERFEIRVDLEQLPSEQLTLIGPLSEYIATSKSAQAQP